MKTYILTQSEKVRKKTEKSTKKDLRDLLITKVLARATRIRTLK